MYSFDVADLDQMEMQQLKELESDLGDCIVAYEESDTSFESAQARVAALSDDQLRRLQQAETGLGAVLIAYD